MSKTMFQNSKGALIFAGATLFGAAIFAGSMGDEGPGAFVAPSNDRERGVSDESEDTEEAAPEEEAVFEDYAPAEDFGNMAFAEDEALIDDASGFDPEGFGTEPNGNTAIITPSNPSSAGRRPSGGPGSGRGPSKPSGSITRGGGSSAPKVAAPSTKPKVRFSRSKSNVQPNLNGIGDIGE
ncbi:hypothetical protein [Erythrobacter crassostreae]|uniref:Uncharacterized protein n=1 Tax=Erythrobacter crassostreae TaxID=2828328 RepID=A0A9X1JM36_9SPHN|nr:hypothetical protein [Erythrobacter crassostrea]MBV7258368.1 hypothetical protein [Erythrobacter crassostrea]